MFDVRIGTSFTSESAKLEFELQLSGLLSCFSTTEGTGNLCYGYAILDVYLEITIYSLIQIRETVGIALRVTRI